MENNICHFVPYRKVCGTIHTINFVLETLPQTNIILKSEALYKMHLVCKGSGSLHIPGQILNLSEGDIFFTFPGTPFCIESGENFAFMYISFLGTRGSEMLDRLGISPGNFLFSGCTEIEEFWKRGLQIPAELTDLVSEGILLYTFSYLGLKHAFFTTTGKQKDDTVSIIKKYIDDNFSSPEFSLEQMSRTLKYNQKYISAVFKKNMKIGITEYLTTIRVQQACTMVNQGFTSVNDIAAYCGYRDPQYFSRVFKSRMGVSPGAYIKATGRK